MALQLIGYTRVSTDEQAMYGYGLDAQETKIREYARRANAEVVVIEDGGYSGKSIERPGLDRALKRIARREADGLVVAKLDRLTRSVLDFVLLLEWFTDAKAQLVVLDFDLDTSTPTGRLMATVMASFAEWERNLIGERTRLALAAARAQGKVIGLPAVSDQRDLTVRIRKMRESGMTYRAICDELNAEGVPTARGAEEWRPSAIQVVLGYRRRSRPKKMASLPDISGRR
jgi:DNA invertase Pin-like site-specific DNA recombinase